MAQFTQKAIMEAFLDLLGKKPLDKITVKDIIETCGITRNTFYYHYRDIYDLLEKIFIYEHEKRLQALKDDSWQEVFKLMLKDAVEHKVIIYHILSSTIQDKLMRYVFDSTDHSLLKYVRREAQGIAVSEEEVRYVADFYRYAFTGFFLKFLWTDMQGDVDEMVDRMGMIVEGNIRNSLINCVNGRRPV